MSTFERKMKLLGGILNFFRKKNRISPSKIHVPKIKTIIIINNKRLGDFLFSTPAIRALREANPSANIVVITSKQNAGMFGKNPFFDKVIFMENCLKDAVKTGMELRSLQPELGIIFHSKCPYDFIALTISGVQCLMKHYFGNERKVLLTVCDNYVLGGNLPPVQNDLMLIEKLNVKSSNKDMFFPAPVSNKQEPTHFKIGLQLGASKADRYFPISTASELISNIYAFEPECEFHLIGTPQEVMLGDKLIDIVKDECKTNIVNHIGKTNLHQLAEIINNLSILITPDTGSLHIATALKTKTVSLFYLKQSNANTPQQDDHLHRVLYASDYSNENQSLNETSKLSPIPARAMIDAVTQLWDRS